MTKDETRNDISRSIEAFTRTQDHVKYEFGCKNIESGAIDCSGFVAAAAKQMASEGVLNKRVPSLFGATSESQIQAVKDHGGHVVEAKGHNIKSQLKEGMVIGIDNGKKGFDAGRDMGIDHVVMTYKDSKTGELMISQSSSGGVSSMKASDWLKQNANDDMYAVDLAEVNDLDLSKVAEADLTPTRGKNKGNKSKKRDFADLDEHNQGIMALFMLLAMFFKDDPSFDEFFAGVLGVDVGEFRTFRDTAIKNGWNGKEAARRFGDYGNTHFDQAEKFTSKFTGSLLDVVKKYESNGGDYNIFNGGSDPKVNGKSVTEMTINEVYQLQDKWRSVKGAASSAVGAYQVVRGSLEEIVKDLHLNPATTIFNKETQDRIALALLEKRGLKDYLDGKMSEKTFMNNIAHEWASLPKNAKGEAAYGGQANNPNYVSAGRYGEVVAAARAAKATFNGVSSGDALAVVLGGKPEVSGEKTPISKSFDAAATGTVKDDQKPAVTVAAAHQPAAKLEPAKV